MKSKKIRYLMLILLGSVIYEFWQELENGIFVHPCMPENANFLVTRQGLSLIWSGKGFDFLSVI